MCSNGEEEYELTPDMMKAGVRALLSFNAEYESPEDGVQRIFWEIINAKRAVKEPIRRTPE